MEKIRVELTPPTVTCQAGATMETTPAVNAACRQRIAFGCQPVKVAMAFFGIPMIMVVSILLSFRVNMILVPDPPKIIG